MCSLFSVACKYLSTWLSVNSRPYSVVLVLTAGLALCAISASAQQTGTSSQNSGAQDANHVWTNKDIDRLRAEGLISILGPEPATEGASPAQVNSGPPAAANPGTARQSTAENETPQTAYDRFSDPEWYAEQGRALQPQIDEAQAALQQAQENLEAVRNLRQPTGGINMAAGSIGITPEEGVAILQEQLRNLQMQQDDLLDMARRNGIEPDAARQAG